MPSLKKKSHSSVEQRKMKKLMDKKCRILAQVWDPQLKGCCFVPANSERCCAITLQWGTRLNSVAICLIAIAFLVFHILGYATIEYYHAETFLANLQYDYYCGGASAEYGYDSCLGIFTTRCVGNLLLIIFCIVGFISAPVKKINPNMLETRHSQATTFFIGLCIGLIFHIFSMFFSFSMWGGISESCFNDTTERIGANSPWKDMFCESHSTVQILLALAQIFFILYTLFVMLITLAYRGWLIIKHMRHFKGFKGGDWSDDEEETKIAGPASAKVAPTPDEDEEDAFAKALEDMVNNDEHEPQVQDMEQTKEDIDEAWIEAEDEEGNTYYTNFLTGESAWSLPTAHLEDVRGVFDDVIDQSEDQQENIETVYKRFRIGEGKDGLIDYEEFCKVLQVDANGQVKKLFDLFDEDNSGKLTIKEFVVGVCNFTGKDTTKKVEFAFRVFDEDNNGFIDVEELCQILRAIHMSQDEPEVQRKAKLIMAKSDINKDGVMSFDEFVEISKKYKNILFPAFNLSNQLGEKLGFT